MDTTRLQFKPSKLQARVMDHRQVTNTIMNATRKMNASITVGLQTIQSRQGTENPYSVQEVHDFLKQVLATTTSIESQLRAMYNDISATWTQFAEMVNEEIQENAGSVARQFTPAVAKAAPHEAAEAEERANALNHPSGQPTQYAQTRPEIAPKQPLTL